MTGLIVMGGAVAAPDTPEEVLAADIEFLKAGLEKDLAGKERRAVPTLKAAAMNLALAGSEELREQALKIAIAIGKKEYTEAKALAATLTPKSGKPGDPVKLIELGKYDLDEVMSAYRAEKVGGMNLEKDIKAKTKTDAKLAALIAARTALLAQYTAALPAEKAAANEAGKKKWEALSMDQLKAAKELAEEAAKNGKDLANKLTALDATCVNCHNQYRD
jgi:hypothetical protein